MKLSGKNIVVFIVLAGAVALAYYLPCLRYNFYQQMMDGLMLDDAQIGLIGSLVNVINTVCYPIGGVLANKFRTKTLIVITLAAFLILSVWYAFAQGFVMLLIIHLLFAFFGIATLWSAYLSAVRGLADERNQSKMFGWNEGTRGLIQFAISLAFVALMGIALNAAQGFTYSMLFAAGVCAVFLVLAIVFMDGKPKVDEQDAAEKADEEPVEKYTVVDVLKNPGVWVVTFLIMCAYVFWTMGNSYLSQYTVDVLGLDPGTASTIGTVRTYLIVAIAGLIGGVLLDKFPYKGRTFIVLLAIDIVLIVGVMITGEQLMLCVALTICISFIANIMKTTYWSTMGEAGIPAAMTPLATGIISFICFMPDWVYPVVFGNWLTDARAADGGVAGAAVAGVYQNIFLIIIAFGVLGMVVSFIHWKRAQKLEAAGVIEIDHHGKK
ncbi:MAG TPA: hypothetical protein DCP91_11285 [Eggerthellaceae bacterium]|nr:hypothetical protein [Eggerthellaceae bacterium]